jgi:hypothetical protein
MRRKEQRQRDGILIVFSFRSTPNLLDARQPHVKARYTLSDSSKSTGIGSWPVSLYLLRFSPWGFAPQYLESRRLRNELNANTERLTADDLELRLAELRDLSGLMLLKAQR